MSVQKVAIWIEFAAFIWETSYLGDFLSGRLPVYATSDVGDFRYVRY